MSLPSCVQQLVSGFAFDFQLILSEPCCARVLISPAMALAFQHSRATDHTLGCPPPYLGVQVALEKSNGLQHVKHRALSHPLR